MRWRLTYPRSASRAHRREGRSLVFVHRHHKDAGGGSSLGDAPRGPRIALLPMMACGRRHKSKLKSEDTRSKNHPSFTHVRGLRFDGGLASLQRRGLLRVSLVSIPGGCGHVPNLQGEIGSAHGKEKYDGEVFFDAASVGGMPCLSLCRSLARDVEQDANRRQRGDERGAAEAHEGQRHAGERDGCGDRANVDRRLRDQPCCDPTSQQRAKGVGRAPSCAIALYSQHGKQRKNRQAAKQSKLLANHREDRIGEGVGQIASLLYALAEATAKQAAGAKRDQPLADLIGVGGGAAWRQGMYKSVEARAAEACFI